MKLSVMIPVYDDPQEASDMMQAVRSLARQCELEFLLVDIPGRAPSLPAAKNQAATAATGEYLLFLFPGIFPTPGAIETLIKHLERDRTLGAVAGRWVNAKGRIEMGYNVRRFPTFVALILDMLLLNKLFPRNRFTRRYKMHDFDHNAAIRAEHANDCVFMLRPETIRRHGGFNEQYVPGWLDQAEFCQSLDRAGERILYEPRAQFVSNENIPLVNRLVRDQYADYRRSECLYIRNHFGRLAGVIARAVVAIGMMQRIAFSLLLPAVTRGWFLSRLRSYVDDDYIRNLRRAYWTVLKRSVWDER